MLKTMLTLALLCVAATPVQAELAAMYTSSLRDELAQNPSWENDETGWNCHSAYSVDGTPRLAKDGTKALKLQYDLAVHKYTPSCSQTLTLEVGEYTIAGWVKTEGVTRTGTGGRITLQSEALDGNIAVTAIQGGTQDWTYYVLERVAVTTAGEHRLSASTYGIPDGKVWWDALSIRRHDVPDVEMYLAAPNFMGKWLPEQDTVRVVVKRTNPAMAAGTIVLTLPDGTVQERRAIPLGDEWATHTLSARGAPALRVQLEAAGANFTPTYNLTRETAFPSGGYVDGNNVLHLPAADGTLTPRFVIGVYHTSGYSHDWGAAEKLGRYFPRLQADLYLNYWLGAAPFEYLLSLGRYLRSMGMAYIDTVNRMALATEARAQALAGQPGILGWYVMDEDELHFAKIRWQARQTILPHAPNMPFYVVSNRLRELYGWRDIGDVVATDPYPHRNNNRNADGSYKLDEVARWTQAAVDATFNSRPAWQVIQFFPMDATSGWPSTESVRKMSWLAICRGARGLFYWSLGAKGLAYVDDPVQREERFAGLVEVVDEIKAHEAALIAPEVPLPEPLPIGVAGVARQVGNVVHVFTCNETNADIADGRRVWRAYDKQIWTVTTGRARGRGPR